MPQRTERLEIRVEPEHKRIIEQAAAASGQVVSQFVVSTTLRGAHEILRQSTVTALTGRDRESFLRILDREQAPSPALVEAFDRHSEKPH